MLSIISSINSLVAQDNLSSSGSAISQAITRLSSGKRINSAADDAAGLAISTTLQTSINSLDQGVSNANDMVSMLQTADHGLNQITQSLQTIRQIAVEAGGGTLSANNLAALQKSVAQQIAEVDRIASQTAYNGIDLLDGSAGIVNVQVGSQVGQTVSVDLSQDLSAGALGVPAGGLIYVPRGTALGTITGLDLTASGAENTSGNPATITQINVLANGQGGYSFTDQNGTALATSVTSNLFATTLSGSTLALSLSTSANNGLDLTNEENAIVGAIGSGNLGTLGVISGISLSSTTGLAVPVGTASAITSITVKNTVGGLQYFDQNGTAIGAVPNIAADVNAGTIPGGSTIGTTGTGAQPAGTILAGINASNLATPASTGTAGGPTAVAAIDVTTTTGVNSAMETIDLALTTVDNIQATLGAAQNRFTGIATSQQAESTDLSGAQSEITDADFAQETANLSKAQVLQQAGISVLAQANSQAQQVLKLLQ